MTRWALVLSSLVPLAGCANTHGQMMEAVDAGVAHEQAARDHERRKEFPPAAARFAQSEGELVTALAVAKARENHVFTSFITTKLSIVSSGQARCLEPRVNPQGSWARAVALYVQAAAYADSITMLKLEANALCDQARCTQPDHDPDGSWERAGELYASAAEVCETMKDDVGRGEAMRRQALCLMQGDRSAITPEARALLTRARRLGDEEATEILAAAGSTSTYCNTCGADLRDDDRFCRQCGHDRNEPAPGSERPDEGTPYPRLGPGGEPPPGAANGPGGGPR